MMLDENKYGNKILFELFFRNECANMFHAGILHHESMNVP